MVKTEAEDFEVAAFKRHLTAGTGSPGCLTACVPESSEIGSRGPGECISRSRSARVTQLPHPGKQVGPLVVGAAG